MTDLVAQLIKVAEKDKKRANKKSLNKVIASAIASELSSRASEYSEKQLDNLIDTLKSEELDSVGVAKVVEKHLGSPAARRIFKPMIKEIRSRFYKPDLSQKDSGKLPPKQNLDKIRGKGAIEAAKLYSHLTGAPISDIRELSLGRPLREGDKRFGVPIEVRRGGRYDFTSLGGGKDLGAHTDQHGILGAMKSKKVQMPDGSIRYIRDHSPYGEYTRPEDSLLGEELGYVGGNNQELPASPMARWTASMGQNPPTVPPTEEEMEAYRQTLQDYTGPRLASRHSPVNYDKDGKRRLPVDLRGIREQVDQAVTQEEQAGKTQAALTTGDALATYFAPGIWTGAKLGLPPIARRLGFTDSKGAVSDAVDDTLGAGGLGYLGAKKLLGSTTPGKILVPAIAAAAGGTVAAHSVAGADKVYDSLQDAQDLQILSELTQMDSSRAQDIIRRDPRLRRAYSKHKENLTGYLKDKGIPVPDTRSLDNLFNVRKHTTRRGASSDKSAPKPKGPSIADDLLTVGVAPNTYLGEQQRKFVSGTLPAAANVATRLLRKVPVVGKVLPSPESVQATLVGVRGRDDVTAIDRGLNPFSPLDRKRSAAQARLATRAGKRLLATSPDADQTIEDAAKRYSDAATRLDSRYGTGKLKETVKSYSDKLLPTSSTGKSTSVGSSTSENNAEHSNLNVGKKEVALAKEGYLNPSYMDKLALLLHDKTGGLVMNDNRDGSLYSKFTGAGVDLDQLLKVAAKKKKPAGTATKRDPAKWSAAKSRAKAKMGGKWSARAAQLAVKYYKGSGGKYKGKKPTAKNNKLKKWSKQDWQWSGERKKKKSTKKKASVNEELVTSLIEFSKEAGKKKKGKGVYLPAKAIDALKSTKKGRKKLRAASRKKSKATREGKQHASHGLHKGKKRSKLGASNDPLILAYIIGQKLATADFGDNNSSDDMTLSYDNYVPREDPKDFVSSEPHGNMTPRTNNTSRIGHTDILNPDKETSSKRDYLERT